jgi:uncharacterized OB-fold protein
MTGAAVKHYPRPTPETETYWQGCRRHELLIQRCGQCSEFQFYPRIICTNCASENLEWVKASGHGEIVTLTIVRRAVSEAYAADVPYVVALIKLDEGPTMMSNVVQCDPETLKIGDPVQVLFEDWSEDISIPKFSPARSST